MAVSVRMGFLALLRSLDELLYELISWLVFFPVTLWRTLRHPWRMMDHADRTLGDSPARQYLDGLSPPLFLFLALMIAHLVELAVVGQSQIVRSSRGLDALVDSDTNLIIMRALLFAVFPLVMASWLVVRQRIGLDRDTLRPPFYSQCYVAAIFALTISLAATLLHLGPGWEPVTGAIFGVALLWYGVLQTHWFAVHLNQSHLRGFADASLAMVASLVLALGAGALFTL